MSRENLQNWADLPSGCFLVLVSGSIPKGRPSNNRIPQSSFSKYKSVEKNILHLEEWTYSNQYKHCQLQSSISSSYKGKIESTVVDIIELRSLAKWGQDSLRLIKVPNTLLFAKSIMAKVFYLSWLQEMSKRHTEADHTPFKNDFETFSELQNTCAGQTVWQPHLLLDTAYLNSWKKVELVFRISYWSDHVFSYLVFWLIIGKGMIFTQR